MAFVATNKAPGVYIDEVSVPGPIQPAGTSTAAFLGPAQKGPLGKPTFLTNAQQFTDTFGSYIEDPQRVYVTHAVKGFFDEGGNTCYFVRVGTGVQAAQVLKDRGATPRATLTVTALTEGTDGNNIKVQVDDASIANTKPTRTKLAALSAGAAGSTQVTVAPLADAALFKPGDAVFLEQAPNSERNTIASISGAALTLSSALANSYAAGTVRLADLIPGQQRIRVDSVAGIETGSYVSISQGATTEQGVVRTVDGVNSSITLTSGLTNLYTMKPGDPNVAIATLEFALTISGPTTGSEVFGTLSLDPRHSRYFQRVVASQMVSVDLADPPTPTPPAKNLPAVQNPAVALTGGVKDSISSIVTTDYHKAIDTLLRLDDVNLLCVPDAVGGTFTAADTQDIQSYMVAHCGKVLNRFAILDSLKGATLSSIVTQRTNLNSEAGHASLYYPWVVISNPLGSGRVTVPPSGHVAGVFANNDNARGVFKAPANEPITMALDLEQILTDDEQGPLNEQGIDIIRSFPGRGILVWGARTIAPSDVTQWRYNSVRRFVSFVEMSLRNGTRFAVFEPNNLTLWGTVKRLVNDFLTTQWAEGALVGATPDQGFSVRIDEQLNPPQLVALGILTIEVKLYPAPPAEFVVFRIIQQPGGASVTE
jgi:phage tail sheath protein FI